MYALIKDGKVAEYPYSIQQFRAANKNISVPETPTEAQLQELGLHIVAQVFRPADEIGKIVTEGTPRLFNDIWTQVWNVRPAAPLELQAQQKQLIDSIVTATQKRLDDFAMTRGYDNVNSIAKYKDITDDEIATLATPEARALVTKFRAECRYLALATANTWAKLYVILGEVQSGSRPTPTKFDDVEPELPLLNWPV